MTRTWVFDLDGTLVDSFGHYFALLSGIFESHGRSFGPELRAAALTRPLPRFFDETLGADSAASALAMLREGSLRDAMGIRPFAGIDAALARLSAGGARLAVWTNRDLESATLILRHSGLEPFFEHVVSGTCVSRGKPDPEGLRKIVDRFGGPGDSVTMVGDHEHDVLAARTVGARAVRASWHRYWDVDPCDHAHHQFRSVAEFSTWVESVSEARPAGART